MIGGVKPPVNSEFNGSHGRCCVDSGIIYSVLEFMDGGSLAHVLKTHKKLGEPAPPVGYPHYNGQGHVTDEASIAPGVLS